MRLNFWTGFLALALLLFGFYLLNPLGPATLDPRARLAGFVPYLIPANSMGPTLQRGDYVMVNVWAYAWNPPRRGDIVAFQSPANEQVKYVKRLLGLPGDRVSMHGHRVYINGRLLDEPYLALDPREPDLHRYGELAEITIADGELFMLGDNRRNSADSRLWGNVPRANVIGRVERIWLAEDASRIGKVH